MQETNIREQLADANQKFGELFSSVSEEQLNTIPFRDSWTPAQVAQHVFKSEAGMLQALHASAHEADRDAYAGVPNIKRIFLDFTTKLNSPEMVVPEQKEYNKKELLQKLTDVAAMLTNAIPGVNQKELVTGLPTGDITKGEIIHFLLYHTRRHTYQLEHVMETLRDKTKAEAATHERIIRLVNDAFIKNDMLLFLSYCTDDIEWNMIGETTWKGKDAILQAMMAKPGEGPDSVIDLVITEGSKTVGTGKFNMLNEKGETKHYQFCDIYTFKDDKIAFMESYVVAIKS